MFSSTLLCCTLVNFIISSRINFLIYCSFFLLYLVWSFVFVLSLVSEDSGSLLSQCITLWSLWESHPFPSIYFLLFQLSSPWGFPYHLKCANVFKFHLFCMYFCTLCIVLCKCWFKFTCSNDVIHCFIFIMCGIFFPMLLCVNWISHTLQLHCTLWFVTTTFCLSTSPEMGTQIIFKIPLTQISLHRISAYLCFSRPESEFLREACTEGFDCISLDALHLGCFSLHPICKAWGFPYSYILTSP